MFSPDGFELNLFVLSKYFRISELRTGIRGGQFLQARPITYHFPKKTYAPRLPSFSSCFGLKRVAPKSFQPYAQNPNFSKLSLSLFQGETLPKTSSKTLHKNTAALRARPLPHFSKANPYQFFKLSLSLWQGKTLPKSRRDYFNFNLI